MANCLHCGAPLSVHLRLDQTKKMNTQHIKCPSCGVIVPCQIENKNIDKQFEKAKNKLIQRTKNPRI